MSDLEDKGGPPAGAADEDLANSDTLAAAEQQRPVPTEVGGFAQLAGDPEGSGGQTPTTGPHRRVTGRQPLAGRTIADGRYTFVERLGKGGMSEVYSARHELLHKTVAIKVLREELAGSRQALERF